MASSLGEVLGCIPKLEPKRTFRVSDISVFEDVRNQVPKELLWDSEASSESLRLRKEESLQILLESPRLPSLR